MTQKFQLHQKVYIISLNKEGIVVGFERGNKSGRYREIYKVRYESDEGLWYYDDYYPVKEYLGKKYEHFYTTESDLKGIFK